MGDERPTFGSLFAGIGGIDLGLERVGWECRFQVEWDEWCQRVLAKHWPDVPRYGDIAAVDWSGVERVDLLAGGFPCQPVSDAGRKLAQDDARWLWPEFLRAIRALRPRLVLVENVPGLLQRGLGIVLGDLAESGYDAEWDCIPAAAVGAPHIRDRVWIVAYPSDDWPGWREQQPPGGEVAGLLAHAVGERLERAGVEPRLNGRSRAGGDDATVADSDGTGSQGHRGFGGFGRSPGQWPPGSGGWPVSDAWLVEPEVGRLAHGLPRGLAGWRVAALKGLGNAVVPQVVEALDPVLRERLALTADTPNRTPQRVV